MGPLEGVKIIELAGIGPGPMCAMLLADLGATVLRIDRKEPSGLGIQRPLRFDLLLRNRKVIALDLKDPQAIELVLELVANADGLIEGFRPGVTERLGLGPDACLTRNPKLAYGRITGWGQEGPLAQFAGHDLNYIAITGVLNAIGRQGQLPSVPLNLIGDYAGGSLYLAMGMLAAIMHARAGGQGQVVDAAIVDGTASLATTFYGMHAAGMWRDERGTNITDSGSHFYDVYACADGKAITIGPIEYKFYRQLLELLEIDESTLGPQLNRENWPAARELFRLKFKSRTRDAWTALLEKTDVCFAPVLSWAEAPSHPHLKARGTFVEIDGVVQPAPAPRFSRTPPAAPVPPAPASQETAADALAGWLTPERIAHFTAAAAPG
ncbi:crotonobetainyl-CoA:carnitine CoA-transferase CaiB-like acyl-CoA transferase [Herbaspirillum rubrisubalbicans]|jgi:crotonobetainyl-CoA:carnitine CoA-transferase CaiB-like acyl-CoA transferase|uniref:CaiB/BaiF CoA transferase family protein n=1 Tax=Herbaspirillum rubrisubalbicans TaxID=80842 RepID=UPI0020A06CB7|nr:CaiB/BaiF CoA-transferase family protein [Herbaspirillum rubrisubalbicans]MCP1572919.1 crotonobetainyl-CoA:carnitine CoA-transferase CaiB-like acyl-CoA transferase [Herbaspirillum rubrisubalbicans]